MRWHLRLNADCIGYRQDLRFQYVRVHLLAFNLMKDAHPDHATQNYDWATSELRSGTDGPLRESVGALDPGEPSRSRSNGIRSLTSDRRLSRRGAQALTGVSSQVRARYQHLVC